MHIPLRQVGVLKIDISTIGIDELDELEKDKREGKKWVLARIMSVAFFMHLSLTYLNLKGWSFFYFVFSFQEFAK